MSRKMKESEMIAWAKELRDKVWYNRHCNMIYRIRFENEKIHPEALKGALEAAQRMRDTYGEENLGPYTDFAWGMLNGKLFAIRCVLGADRNEPGVLDT